MHIHVYTCLYAYTSIYYVCVTVCLCIYYICVGIGACISIINKNKTL